MPEAVTVSAPRTPIGTARKGMLRDTDAYQLADHVVGAIAADLDSAPVDWFPPTHPDRLDARAWASVGVDPAPTGLAPVEVIPKALGRAGISLDDVDLFEINEAFAAMCAGGGMGSATRYRGSDALNSS